MNIETTAEPIREGLPSLPKGKMLSGMDMESLHVLYTAGQMQDYARAALAARAAAPVSAQPQAMPEVDALCNRIVELRAALRRIANTGFGWDGDCGVTTVAEDALYTDEQTEAAAPPSPQPVAESVFDEFDRLRKLPKVPGYCAGTLHTEREAFDLAVRSAAALQPVARQDEAGGVNEALYNAIINLQPESHQHIEYKKGHDAASVEAANLVLGSRMTAPAIEPVAGLTDADIDVITLELGMGTTLYENDPQWYCREFARRLIQRHITGQSGATGESK